MMLGQVVHQKVVWRRLSDELQNGLRREHIVLDGDDLAIDVHLAAVALFVVLLLDAHKFLTFF
jgi:hypothetical protein